MRVIQEINHPNFKITLFAWNNRYILKFENGKLEQTYKIDQFDVASENELKELLNEQFLHFVHHQFNAMEEQLYRTLHEPRT